MDGTTLFDRASPQESYTAGQMRAMLRERHKTNEWALMFEVGNSTGWQGGRRWADAVAVHLWPSKGNAIHGFEVKISRSDWLREVKNPTKAEEIEQYCDYWWVAAPKGVVGLSELPTGWGLMEAASGKLRVVVRPTQRQNITPLDRGFVAAMLRRASGADAAEIASLVEKEVAPLRANIRSKIELEVERRSAAAAAIADKVARIEALAGTSIDNWTLGEDFGRAVRLVHSLGVESPYGRVNGLKKACEGLLQAIGELSPSPEIGE